MNDRKTLSPSLTTTSIAEASGGSALAKWRPLFDEELAQVDAVILQQTESEITLIPQMVQHIIKSGGKRLRPILTILSAKLFQYKGARHVNLGASIEFLHTATLLHDDVVDESELRRGVDTANIVWGNAASVLVGDFLLSRAFQLMARDGSLKVLELLSDASAVITQGEVQQLMAANDINTDEETYLEIISSKTAQLFAAACCIGAVITEQDEATQQALFKFGLNLGVAFQIVDDALDYSARQEELGKTIGDDFREGKVTLPVIIAYHQGKAEEKAFWDMAISNGGSDEQLVHALELVRKHHVLQEVFATAQTYAAKAEEALTVFPNSEVKTALLDLLHFSVNRPY